MSTTPSIRPAHRRPDGIEMRRVGRTRIHHVGAHHVGVRPVERERRRVGRPHPPNAAGISVPNLHARIVAEVSSIPLGLELAEVVRCRTRGAPSYLRWGSSRHWPFSMSCWATRAVLVELLAAGPLLAATGAGPRRTAIVAVYAFVLSVPLGLAGDAFGSVQHVVGRARRGHRRSTGRGAQPAPRAARGAARARARRTRGGHAGPGRARGHAQRHRRRGDGPGAGRQPDLRERRGPDDARIRVSGGADEHPARRDPRPLRPLRGVGRALPGRAAARAPRALRARARPRRSSASGCAPRARSAGRSVKSTPVHDDDGFLRMAINVIEDITAHKRSELAERFLSESSRLLASSLDPDEVLERVAQPGRAGGGGLVRGGRAARRRRARARRAGPHRPRDAREGPRGEPPLPAARRPADRAGERDPHRALGVRGGGARRAAARA